MPYFIRVVAFSALIWAVITFVLGIVLNEMALILTSTAIATFAILVIVIETLRYRF